MRSKELKKLRRREKQRQLRKERFGPSRLVAVRRLVVEPAGPQKMSEVLEEFIEPYLVDCPTEEALRKLVLVAQVAWNAALFSGAKRTEFLARMAETLPEFVRQDFAAIVTELMDRKEALFAANKRMIVGCESSITQEGLHLVVLSTLPAT